jgi:hypothetical protein
MSFNSQKSKESLMKKMIPIDTKLPHKVLVIIGIRLYF